MTTAARNLTRYARYSIAASVITLALKYGAWFATGSVGLLSDATESLVNLAAGIMALATLTYAARPADHDHAYGHGKIEYFSSGAEGLLIIVAAAGIAWTAVQRFISPQPLANLGPGLAVALAAAAVNFFTAQALLTAAKRFDSITLEADARHLFTDVWTSAGMVTGLSVLLFAPPSWQILDPVIAILMAGNIVFTGVGLIRRSAAGLLDRSLPENEMRVIEQAIRTHAALQDNAAYHGVRARKSGHIRFVDFHLLVPGSMSVTQAHELTSRIEESLRRDLPHCQVTIHVEPLEADASHHDGHDVT